MHQSRPTLLKPLALMAERLSVDRQDSDVTYFYSLLFYGEMLTKLVVAGVVAGIADDKDRNQYRLLHQLVRADGIGEWGSALDEALTGPASQHLQSPLRDEQRQLTQKVGPGEWQYDAVAQLLFCFEAMDIPCPPLGARLAAKIWFNHFATFRNKTRGHRAPQGHQCSSVCNSLQNSINLIAEHFLLFQRPWAYVHRNLSGKYRVTPLGGDQTPFGFLKHESTHNYPDGVYLHTDHLVAVQLVNSDVDAGDFLFPNGQFSDRDSTFETISYITNASPQASGIQYVSPVGQLPDSETQGRGDLDAFGECWTNLPPQQKGYVDRPGLERRLHEQLIFEHHPIVTLTGPGGIGKTSLALKVLYDLTSDPTHRYEVIIWFSARDIDLLSTGPKPVRRHIMSKSDLAAEYVRLLRPVERLREPFDHIAYFSSVLTKGPVGPTLFVVDNFETVDSPGDLYNWVDTFIRPPNKVLITTRIGGFAADYPVDVAGMTEREALSLINRAADQLQIQELITPEYASQLYSESDGHPYVIKILLGEAAKAGAVVKPERIIAVHGDILTALFERTYARLAPAAQRVFLLLCNWRSVLPEVAIEAVVLRSETERTDVRGALTELKQSSFIEEITSSEDGEAFINVPLAAALFGKRKLTASPLKPAVEADTVVLQAFGAGQKDNVRHGILPRINRMLRKVAEDIARGEETLENVAPMLEFMGNRVPAVGPTIASLYEEQGGKDGVEMAKRFMRLHLEKCESSREASQGWKRLADLCRTSDDSTGEIHALAELCRQEDASLYEVSSAANRINGILRRLKDRGIGALESDERKILISAVAEALESRLFALNADDCSRLAWLHVHLNELDRAMQIVEKGLAIDATNVHCQGLRERLEEQGF